MLNSQLANMPSLDKLRAQLWLVIFIDLRASKAQETSLRKEGKELKPERMGRKAVKC